MVMVRWEIEISGSLKIQGPPSLAKLLYLRTEISGHPLIFTLKTRMHMICMYTHIHVNTNINIYAQEVIF